MRAELESCPLLLYVSALSAVLMDWFTSTYSDGTVAGMPRIYSGAGTVAGEGYSDPLSPIVSFFSLFPTTYALSTFC